MTLTDYKLRKAIKVAREYGLGIKNIIPEKGKRINRWVLRNQRRW